MSSEEMYELINKKRSELGVIYAIILIQLRSGCRISEVLSISYKQVINSTDIWIEGSKGSRSKRVHLPEISDVLERTVKNKLKPFSHISRYQVYRYYKRLGIVLDNGKNRNNSVTHMLRKQYIRETNLKTNDIRKTAEITGHKSTRSTEQYLK